MDTFLRFLFEFLGQIYNGILKILMGLYEGVISIFNVKKYVELLNFYKKDFNGAEWLFVVLSIVIVIVFFAAIFFLLYFLIRKYVRFRKTIVEQEVMLEEVSKLNKEVATLYKEKEEILAMKVSNLGLKPHEILNDSKEDNSEKEENSLPAKDIRFSKLNEVDIKYENYKVELYNNNFNLAELCELFRNFAASQLKLFYKPQLIRLFIAALSSSKLIILQGISGTGKTSLAYAWGKFLSKDSCIASVQPSWRDRTELFGYFNEFTKRFNETDVLRELYEAGYTDDIHTVILDEMNIARVEYYFAEMLSILEMPNHDEWIVELVAGAWKSDPKNIIGGKLKIPSNAWYIGTINNDDSTFMVTDKVYDRAMPIDINEKGQVFEPEPIPAQKINFTYVDKLFKEAIEKNPISQDTLDKIEAMDDYVIQHFRIAFGNRIVAHMKKFVPVFVECGGDEVEGVDYFVAKKILRKFEQLNISYIRDEIDGFIEFLDKTFGKDRMKECQEYLLRLKKLT